MYREDTWTVGCYIDNMEKHKCAGCNNSFIVGTEMLKRMGKEKAKCPYCGGSETMTEKTVWTEDGQLEELYGQMGCLALHIDDSKDFICGIPLDDAVLRR